MATNLALDDKLIEQVRRLGKYRTKREAVSAALEEFVRRRKQVEIIGLFGTVEYDPAYDYKRDRNRRKR